MKYDYRVDPRPEIISHAQNREDIWLHILLGGKRNGFYVDIGANDPVSDSVTQFFYERGWHGINVEPNSELAKLLKQQRARDTTLQYAVSDTSGSIQFREYTGKAHGLSTASKTTQREPQKKNLAYREYQIEAVTLREIFERYAKGRQVDFLKIDVEGLEYEVITGNDWDTYRPRIVVAEVSHVDTSKDWTALLRKYRYEQVLFDGLNVYFAAKEYVPKISFANYPKIVLEGTPIISGREFRRRDNLLRQYERVWDDYLDLKGQNARFAKLLRMAFTNPPKFYSYMIYRKLKGRWPKSIQKEGA